jgi:hypothetical protein
LKPHFSLGEEWGFVLRGYEVGGKNERLISSNIVGHFSFLTYCVGG